MEYTKYECGSVEREVRAELIEDIEGLCGSLLSVPWELISTRDMSKMEETLSNEYWDTKVIGE